MPVKCWYPALSIICLAKHHTSRGFQHSTPPLNLCPMTSMGPRRMHNLQQTLLFQHYNHNIVFDVAESHERWHPHMWKEVLYCANMHQPAQKRHPRREPPVSKSLCEVQYTSPKPLQSQLTAQNSLTLGSMRVMKAATSRPSRGREY